MQLDQLGDVGDHVLADTAAASAARGPSWRHHLVVVERDPAAGQPRTWSAACRCRAAAPPAAAPGPAPGRTAAPGRSPGQHGKRVLVHVLVPEVLVRLQPEPGHLGQHLVGHSGVDQQRDARPPGRPAAATAAAWSARPDPLGRHLGRRQQPASSAHRGRTSGLTVKPSWAVNRAARRIRSGSSVNESSGCPGVRSTLRLQVGQSAERVHQLMPGQPGGHRVHREVPPGQVVLQRVAVGHLRLARGPVVALAPVGGDLERGARPCAARRCRTRSRSSRPGRPSPPTMSSTRSRRRIRGQVEITGLPAEEDDPGPAPPTRASS